MIVRPWDDEWCAALAAAGNWRTVAVDGMFYSVALRDAYVCGVYRCCVKDPPKRTSGPGDHGVHGRAVTFAVSDAQSTLSLGLFTPFGPVAVRRRYLSTCSHWACDIVFHTDYPVPGAPKADCNFRARLRDEPRASCYTTMSSVMWAERVWEEACNIAEVPNADFLDHSRDRSWSPRQRAGYDNIYAVLRKHFAEESRSALARRVQPQPDANGEPW